MATAAFFLDSHPADYLETIFHLFYASTVFFILSSFHSVLSFRFDIVQLSGALTVFVVESSAGIAGT